MSDPDLAIARIQTFAVQLPHHDRFGGQSSRPQTFGESTYYFEDEWTEVYSQTTQTLLLRIETAGGYFGWGECQAPIVPASVKEIIDSLFGPMLLGRNAMDVHPLGTLMYGSMNVRGHTAGLLVDAIAGLDIALWDLRGRILNASVSALLGGRYRETLPMYISGIRASTTQDRIALARQYVDVGFAGVKLYLGRGVSSDAKEATAVRGGVPPSCRLFSDLFWKYSLPEATKLGRVLGALDVEWLESPMQPENVADHAALARSIDAIVAVGEPLRTPYEFRDWLVAGALDVAQPDVARCGISNALRIAELAATFHRPVALHVGVCLGVAMAATWQVAAATPNFYIQEHEPAMLALANEHLAEPLVVDNGTAVVPTGHGHGAEVVIETFAGMIAATHEVRL